MQWGQVFDMGKDRVLCMHSRPLQCLLQCLLQVPHRAPPQRVQTLPLVTCFMHQKMRFLARHIARHIVRHLVRLVSVLCAVYLTAV